MTEVEIPTGHTPAPWEIAVDEDHGNLRLTGPSGEEVVAGCGCCDSPYMNCGEQNAPNARLIALAPMIPAIVEELAEARKAIDALRSQNDALMRERTSMIATHRGNLALAEKSHAAELAALRAKLEVPVDKELDDWERDLRSGMGFAPMALMQTADVITALRARVAELEAGQTEAASDVLAERRRQVEVEGWTPEHDDQHVNGEMAGAAACYALYRSHVDPVELMGEGVLEMSWPWDPEWWKPTTRRRDLVKAAALILAEIERLDRDALSEPRT